MPMNLPTLADLQGTYGAGDPAVYRQAREQQGLAQQFAQGELSGQTQDIRKKELANIFDEQQNPQLLEQRRLQNIGLVDANTLSGVTSRRAVANEPMQLSEDQRKFALTATEQDLKQAEQWAQGEIQSGDPRRMEEAKKILDFSVAARTARAKEEGDMARQKEQTRSHLSGIGMQIEGQKKLRQMDIDAGKYSKNGAAAQGLSGIQSAVTAGKMTAEKAAVALHGAAMFEPDPELKQKYEQMAGQYEQFAMQQRNAAAGGKLDIGAMTGQPTLNLPPALGGGTLAPQMTAQDQAALAWANANPNDPRAAKIKQKLGK